MNMTKECTNMEELIVGYINDRLNISDKMIFLNHLSTCSNCRKDLATTLELSKVMIKMEKKITEEIKEYAFSIIHNFDKEESVENLSVSSSGYNAIKIIKDTVFTTRKSIKLAFKFI